MITTRQNDTEKEILQKIASKVAEHNDIQALLAEPDIRAQLEKKENAFLKKQLTTHVVRTAKTIVEHVYKEATEVVTQIPKKLKNAAKETTPSTKIAIHYQGALTGLMLDLAHKSKSWEFKDCELMPENVVHTKLNKRKNKKNSKAVSKLVSKGLLEEYEERVKQQNPAKLPSNSTDSDNSDSDSKNSQTSSSDESDSETQDSKQEKDLSSKPQYTVFMPLCIGYDKTVLKDEKYTTALNLHFGNAKKGQKKAENKTDTAKEVVLFFPHFDNIEVPENDLQAKSESERANWLKNNNTADSRIRILDHKTLAATEAYRVVAEKVADELKKEDTQKLLIADSVKFLRDKLNIILRQSRSEQRNQKQKNDDSKHVEPSKHTPPPVTVLAQPVPTSAAKSSTASMLASQTQDQSTRSPGAVPASSHADDDDPFKLAAKQLALGVAQNAGAATRVTQFLNELAQEQPENTNSIVSGLVAGILEAKEGSDAVNGMAKNVLSRIHNERKRSSRLSSSRYALTASTPSGSPPSSSSTGSPQSDSTSSRSRTPSPVSK